MKHFCRMKSIRFLLLLFVVVTTNHLNAQHNLLPGYIIKNNGDTVQGFLKYERDAKLSQRVLFFTNKKEKTPQVFTPSELKGFVFNTQRTFSSVPMKEDTVRLFAKKVAWGKISLYTADSRKSGYYLQRNDTSLSVVLLPPKQKTIKKDGKTYTYKDKSYIGLLAFITKDQKTNLNPTTLKYRTRSIKQYIDSYNKDFSESFPSGTYRDSIRYSFDVSFGIPLIIKSDMTQFRGSFYVTRMLIEHNPVLSYQAGISYRYWGSRREIDSSAFWQTIKLHYIGIMPLGLRITANTNKVVPYGHFSFGLHINQERYYSKYSPEDLENSLAFGLAFNVGAGVKFKISRKFYITDELTPSVGIYKHEGFNLFFNLGVSF